MFQTESFGHLKFWSFENCLGFRILCFGFIIIYIISAFICVKAEEYIPLIGKYGGSIIISTTSDPRSFNPILAKETSTTVITSLIFEGLTRTDGITLQVMPNLAKSWQISEDGLVFTFFLREDVFWQDGVRFTSDDVVFTFNELIFNPEIPNSARDIFTVEGKPFKVEKIDDFTVRFILPKRFAPFLRSMSQEILPKHILKESVEKKEFNFTWGLDTSPEKIVGTGAFKIFKYLPSERIELERNELYWRKDNEGNRLPYLDKIIFLIVPNQDTALLKFQEGELDYYSLRGQDFPILKRWEEKKGDFKIYRVGADFGSNFLVFNQNPNFLEKKKLKWFSDLNFRRAISHTIDREKIISIVMNGFGYPQYSPMSPSSGFFYNPNVERYSYDLEKAKSILKETGYLDRDGDGIIEDKDGHKIEFNLFTNSGSTERVQIASIIRKDLERIGMKVNFLALEFNSLVTKLVSTFDWDCVLVGLTGGIEPHFGKNVWHSSGHLHMWYPLQKHPFTEWEKRIDRIFDIAVSEFDEDRRKILYDEWQEIISKELPLIYTVLPEVIFAVRNRFENLYPTSYGGAFWNIEEIFIKKH